MKAYSPFMHCCVVPVPIASVQSIAPQFSVALVLKIN